MIDLTKRINADLATYKDDPKVSLKHIKTIKKDGYNDYLLTMNMHTGTHIDGINHMKDFALISDIPLNNFKGVGRIVDDKFIYNNETVLIFQSLSYLTEKLIDTLAIYSIKFIVTEENSVDEAPYPLHHKLFENNIMIVENACNLAQLDANKTYMIYAMPLKIDSDSSPVRLFAEEIK